MPLTFHLTSAAGVVTGTVEGLPTTPAEIHEGKLDGDTVSFWLNTDYQGQTYKLVYKGKVTAGQIAFTFGTDDGSWGSANDGDEGDVRAENLHQTPEIMGCLGRATVSL